MQYSKKLIALSIAVATLTGCAIEPTPIKDGERLAGMLKDQAEIYSKQEPITAPLTFYDALAQALKYNYDHRLTMIEAVLQDTQLDVSKLNMLARLAINAGYIRTRRSIGFFKCGLFQSVEKFTINRVFNLSGCTPWCC